MAEMINNRPQTWLTFPSAMGGPPERVDYAWRLSRPAVFQACLARHHGKLPRPHCDCHDQGRPLQLSIKGRTDEVEGQRRTVYHLACQKQEGPLHRPGCPFHGTSEIGQSDAARMPAIRSHEDGTVSMTVDIPFGLAKSVADAEGPREQERERGRFGSGGLQRNRLTLLGLLWAIWDRAHLSGWSPAQTKARFPRVLRQRLLTAMAGLETNGVALAQVADVVLWKADCRATALQDLAVRNSGRSRVLLIGRLSALPMPAPTPHAPDRWRMSLDGTSDVGLSVFIERGRLGNWAGRYPLAARVLGGTDRPSVGANVFVILTATMRVYAPPAGPTRVIADVQDYALMETSLQMVPVASALELRVADDLVAAGRRFSKPLRYDPDAEPVLPDFVLQDTGAAGRRTPMEVFGRTDEAYQARQAEKTAWYDLRYGRAGWWSWEPAIQPEPPPFPPAALHGQDPDARR
ncbi:DUF1173 family protein [Gluconacetobacter sacchari]|uniref:DUF1173 family protein n=2 Tax=Gluconacetobacter sacchari TaxID=92759 RepID=A0A7W4IET4_9PROT|nr:DUF1173 family protein [Gluconacetobacter sacchari]MBB2161555.1 DUF1173 family protein [Gluconacetobacter sacchari]